jgi:MOSC domain-containing protein YiiM
MERQVSVRAVGNLGLEGDYHAHPDGARQVLLIEAETLERLGLEMSGVMENITTRGIALMALECGTRVRVGEALLEVTQPCAPCARMDEIRPGLRTVLEGQRGMLARVIEGGEMRVGDAIRVERAK